MTSTNYRMPAEWEPHEATWIGWPVNESDWPGKLPAVQSAFVEIVRHLASCEHVHILVPDENTKKDTAQNLQAAHVDLAAVERPRCARAAAECARCH